MQYYVIGPDGNKYGPADVPTLKQWIVESRLSAESMLEDFNTGQRMPASSVPGLFEGAPTMTAPGAAGPMGPVGTPQQSAPMSQAPGHYPRSEYGVPGDNGQSELTKSFVFSALGLVCCFIFSIFGLINANKAMEKGNPTAGTARTVAIVVLVLNVLGFIFAMVSGVLGGLAGAGGGM